jgi:hypothetical protein
LHIHRHSAPANDLFGHPRALLRLATLGRAHCKTLKGLLRAICKGGTEPL